MAHKHSVYDTDLHYKIDAITGAITDESTTKRVLKQNDHNSERRTFEIPRYIDGHDTALCNKIYIHYLNIDAATREENPGMYEVTDMQLSPEDENVVILSWLISRNVTKFAGSLSFLISFLCISDSGEIDYQWNTDINSDRNVSKGMNNSEVVVEKYADVIEQWRQQVLKDMETQLQTTARNIVTEAMAAEFAARIPDFSINDKTSKGFIKNRPVYDERITYTVPNKGESGGNDSTSAYIGNAIIGRAIAPDLFDGCFINIDDIDIKYPSSGTPTTTTTSRRIPLSDCTCSKVKNSSGEVQGYKFTTSTGLARASLYIIYPYTEGTDSANLTFDNIFFSFAGVYLGKGVNDWQDTDGNMHSVFADITSIEIVESTKPLPSRFLNLTERFKMKTIPSGGKFAIKPGMIALVLPYGNYTLSLHKADGSTVVSSMGATIMFATDRDSIWNNGYWLACMYVKQATLMPTMASNHTLYTDECYIQNNYSDSDSSTSDQAYVYYLS